MTSPSKLYVLSYHEVQIAGYRVFASYEEALKEYLMHCIIETKELLSEDDDTVSEKDDLSESADESCDDEEESVEEIEEDSGYDDMTCVLEIQELQGNEFMTIKEYDYEPFQMFLEEKEDIPEYLDELQKAIEENNIPQQLLDIFSA
jgi:hypothetical protein